MTLSPYLIAIAAAWIVAQGAKYAISVVKSGSIRNFRQLYLSGNMPSAHSASVIALLTVIGGLNGVESAVFAVAALFAAIVMYDAVMVRRSSGEQGEAIKALLKEQKSNIRVPRTAKGHTPLEVAVGALLGLIVGLAVIALTNVA
ncbi:MAG TPA: divergent PAP2 family protein [Candidatus Saccharibacteria bacterium]|nr:divergent PAP2 family protein [Candidatus Saccharibacteria bacterium]